MSLMMGRGGMPHVLRAAVDNTTGLAHVFRMTHPDGHQFGFTSFFLSIRATTNPCKVYFTEADFTADENYVSVPVAADLTPHGEWSGPVEATGVWLKGDGGTSDIELVAYRRLN